MAVLMFSSVSLIFFFFCLIYCIPGLKQWRDFSFKTSRKATEIAKFILLSLGDFLEDLPSIGSHFLFLVNDFVAQADPNTVPREVIFNSFHLSAH